MHVLNLFNPSLAARASALGNVDIAAVSTVSRDQVSAIRAFCQGTDPLPSQHKRVVNNGNSNSKNTATLPSFLSQSNGVNNTEHTEKRPLIEGGKLFRLEAERAAIRATPVTAPVENVAV